MKLTHGDIWCDKYKAEVMPDELGNCSLCGATLNAGYEPNFEYTMPTNKGQARELAIDWQDWASEQSLSYAELAEWEALFEKLGRKYQLTKEFKENGII